MRVLFILSQRPELTGSGITLDALVRESAAAGHEPWVLCSVPADRPKPSVGGLPQDRVLTVTFGQDRGVEPADLPFPVPGMSDVMPYASTVWSNTTTQQLALYRDAWRRRLAEAIETCRPDVVHCNHLWLVSALVPDVLEAAAGSRRRIPSLVHCHATGLRQMLLCPHLRDEVVAGARRHDAFLTPHADMAGQVAATLDVSSSRVVDVGAGYREDLFHTRDAAPASERCGRVLYVGKYAAAKGMPWLLDVCEMLWQDNESFTLHVAGDGAGPEAEALRARMAPLVPDRDSNTATGAGVVLHGRLDQAALGDLMRRVGVLVLPSFYEGLPLVLVEARACGCRLVSTALSGIAARLAPALGPDLILVDPPRMIGADSPVSSDLPAFTRRLAAALRAALVAGPVVSTGQSVATRLAPFTWSAVFRRVEEVWNDITGGDP